jgi:hypothetical protein
MRTREEVHRLRVASLIFAIVCGIPLIGHPQVQVRSWLDESKPVSWNKPGMPIPSAPHPQGDIDPRCRTTTRLAELDADKRLRNRGWNLVGPYQGGWRVLVIGGTASYDGMCRPLQYQEFVFVRGVFAGTLSPQVMDSRTDAALSRVYLQGDRQLTAEYARYAPTDPLCCPSKTTSVQFEIAKNPPLVQPVSASTASNR